MISQLRAEKEFFTTEQKPSQHIALRCLYVSTKAITAPDLRILEFNLVLLIILLPLLLLLIDIITLSRLAILKIVAGDSQGEAQVFQHQMEWATMPFYL